MAKENTKEFEEKNQDNGVIEKMVNSPVNRTIAGGVIGAGVGLAMTPKNRERILCAAGLIETENTIGQSVKDKVADLKDSGIANTEKATKKLKDKITNNDEDETESDDHEDHDEDETPYQALQSENEELQERLQQLEDKLDKFAKSKEKSGKK